MTALDKLETNEHTYEPPVGAEDLVMFEKSNIETLTPFLSSDLYFVNKKLRVSMNDAVCCWAIDVSEESSGQGWYRGVTGCGWLVEIRQSAKHQK